MCKAAMESVESPGGRFVVPVPLKGQSQQLTGVCHPKGLIGWLANRGFSIEAWSRSQIHHTFGSSTRPMLRANPPAAGRASEDFMLSNSICFPLAAWRVLRWGIHSVNLHGNIRTLFILLKARGLNIEEERRGPWMCFCSSWLVLAVSLSTRSACVQLVLWK